MSVTNYTPELGLAAPLIPWHARGILSEGRLAAQGL
jgi:hypothetical protein